MTQRRNLMKKTYLGSALVLLAVAIACGTIVDRNGVTDAQILGSNGGSLQTTKGLEIHVPAGALSKDTELTVHSAAGLPEVVTAVEIGPSGTQFTTPVTLSFTYPANTPNP